MVTVRGCTWHPAGLPVLLSTANGAWELYHFTAIGRLSFLHVMGPSESIVIWKSPDVCQVKKRKTQENGACYSGVDISKSSTTYRQASYHSHESSKKSTESTGGITCLKKANEPCPKTAYV